MIQTLLSVEEKLITMLGWPGWALRVIATLQLLVGITSALQAIFVSDGADHNDKKDHKRTTTEFRWFQLQYLGVYLTIMVADWLQGTNIYTLYSVSRNNTQLIFHIYNNCYFTCYS